MPGAPRVSTRSLRYLTYVTSGGTFPTGTRPHSVQTPHTHAMHTCHTIREPLPVPPNPDSGLHLLWERVRNGHLRAVETCELSREQGWRHGMGSRGELRCQAGTQCVSSVLAALDFGWFCDSRSVVTARLSFSE